MAGPELDITVGGAASDTHGQRAVQLGCWSVGLIWYVASPVYTAPPPPPKRKLRRAWYLCFFSAPVPHATLRAAF